MTVSKDEASPAPTGPSFETPAAQAPQDEGRSRENPNESAPEGASRCRTLTSSLSGWSAAQKGLALQICGQPIKERGGKVKECDVDQDFSSAWPCTEARRQSPKPPISSGRLRLTSQSIPQSALRVVGGKDAATTRPLAASRSGFELGETQRIKEEEGVLLSSSLGYQAEAGR